MNSKLLGYFTVESGIVIIGDRENLTLCHTFSDDARSKEFANIVKITGQAEVGGNIGISTGTDRGVYEVHGIFDENHKLLKIEIQINSSYWCKGDDTNE